MFNWDDLRYFLELSRRGRLVSAAQRLGVDHTTVARRITALEESLNTRLFDRTPRGYQLTKAGQALLTHAESMEAQSIGLYQDVSGQDATLTGTVRIAATEGLAIEFLARSSHRTGMAFTAGSTCLTRSYTASRSSDDDTSRFFKSATTSRADFLHNSGPE